MAKRETVEVTDDIDGSVITGLGETIAFSVDGVDYSIDLKAKNAKEFRGIVEHWIAHATRVGGRRRPASAAAGAVAATTRTPATASASASAGKRDPEQTRAIRQWAADHGYEVRDRGRIPSSIEQAYNAANPR